MADSKVNAKFAFQRPGTQPPVYVAGSFSNPPWQPHQMEATQRDDGEYIFTKSWPVEEGVDVQYKYRIGDGDWWVLDDSEPVGKFSRHVHAWPKGINIVALKLTLQINLYS